MADASETDYSDAAANVQHQQVGPPSRAAVQSQNGVAGPGEVGAAQIPTVIAAATADATADARDSRAGRLAAEQSARAAAETERAADRDQYEASSAASQPVVSSLHRRLHRSQSAAGADRLGYRFGGGAAAAAISPLSVWNDEAYGTVRGAAAAAAAAAAASSDGLHACSTNLERRLTLGLASPSTRTAAAATASALQAAGHVLCACGRQDVGPIASLTNYRACGCAEAAADDDASASPNGRSYAGAIGTTLACECSPMSSSSPAASDAIDRIGAAPALEKRGWRFRWGRSRKSDSLPAAGVAVQAGRMHNSVPSRGDDGPGVDDLSAAQQPLLPPVDGASSSPGKRKSKVCRKCSQLVKAIRKRFSRKRSRASASWTKCSAVSGLQRRRSVSVEGVTYDFDQREERPSFEELELATGLVESDTSAIVSSASSVALPSHWMVASRSASRPTLSPSTLFVVHNTRGRVQLHPASGSAISDIGLPPAVVPATSTGASASLVANFPRERHRAVRVAPGSPPPPGSAWRVGGLLPSQLTSGALLSHPGGNVRSVAAAAAAATVASSAAAQLAYGSGGSSSAVRAHTTVDYAHFLVPDLRSIASSAYYWCVMDRYEAERALEGKPEGTFLLRDSAQDDFLFSVSFRRYGRSLHARVEQRDHSFSFDAHDVGVFRSPTVTGLVEHYKDADSCLFFEPLLIRPLPRPQPLSLQQLARSAICGSGVTYDGVAQLPLPRNLVEYVRYYHYKHKVRSRTVGSGTAAASSVPSAACALPPSSAPLGDA